MKTNIRFACAAIALALGTAVHAEEFMLLKAKVELLVGQAKELYDDSFKKGSDCYGPAYQYYYGLMYATGTNLLGRSESAATTQRMKKYYDMIEKDYEAYTKVEAATAKAAATGSDKVYAGRNVAVVNGSRHRAKRLANAQKMGDKELGEAVKRWEKFATQLAKEQKK